MIVPRLVYYWCVEYRNGKRYVQFDFETGREMYFGEATLRDAVKLVWLPFTKSQAERVEGAVARALPVFSMTIPDGAQPIIYRNRRVKYGFSKEIVGQETHYILGWRLGNMECVMIIDEAGNCHMVGGKVDV